MPSIVTRKYAQALIATFQTSELESLLTFLKPLGLALEQKQVSDLLTSPFLTRSQKESVILACAQHTSQKVQNFLKVLVASDRIMLVSDIVHELEKKVFEHNKEYIATLSSNETFEESVLAKLQDSLAKKLNAKLNIHQKQDSAGGVKLSVEDLGVEISFSEKRFGYELKKHILKAL